MKKHPSSTTGRRLLPAFLIVILVAAITLFYACGSPKENGHDSENKEFTLNCVILTKAQLQTWVDSGWTRAGSEILLQFYSPDVSMSHNNTGLVAYPGESSTSVKKGGKQVLAVDTTCTGLKVTGAAILSNIQVMVDKLSILGADGKLGDFDYIRFKPVRFSGDNDYISFTAEKVTGGKAEQMGGQQPPCPPWCCPPYCDNN